MKGAVSKTPKQSFGFQNGAKIIKNRGPGALQQQTGSGEVPEAKKDPKFKFRPPRFGSRFEVKTRPKNEVCSERSFGEHWLQLTSKTNQNCSKTAANNDSWKTLENCALAQARAHLSPLRRDPKTSLFWKLSSEPSGDPSWEPL